MSTSSLPSRLGTVLVFTALSGLSFSAAAANAPARRVVLATGSVIPVRLDRELSSKTARTGQRFTATVRFGSDDSAFPEGTRIEGVLRDVQRHKGSTPGSLDLDFRRMVTPGGQSRALSGSLISLDGKDVRATEGRLVASSNKSKDRLKFIGIGAGSGLLIGKLTKKDSFMSTLLGASAGYLYNEFGNKPKPGDVSIKAGAEFGVRLDRPLTFSTNRDRDTEN